MSTYTAPLDDARLKRFLQYVLVGAVGLGINEGTLFVSTALAGLPYVVGGALGRVLSVAFNYVVNDAWTWNGHGERGVREWTVRGGKYVATRVVGIAIGLSTLVLLVEVGGMHYLVANLVAVGAGILWGFAASELWVWGSDDAAGGRPAALDRTDPIDRRGIRDRIGGIDPPALRERYDLDPSTVRERVVGRVAAVDTYTWVVLGLSAVLFVVLSWYTVSLYRSFWSTGADLGAYTHAFSTTLDGTGFLQQGKYRINHPGGSYWGAHFSLTLLVFLVPFAIHPSPETLLVTKAFVLAASVPLFWFVARDHVENERIGFLLTFAYALNPFFLTAAMFDFQEQILLPIFVFGSYLAYRKRRYGPFLALLALAMLTNEFVVYVAVGFLVGLAVVAHREGRLEAEAPVFALGGAIALGVKVLSALVISRFSRFSGIPTKSVSPPIVDALAAGGETPARYALTSILLALATDPTLAVESLAFRFPMKLLFFGLILLPAMFVPLADEVTVASILPYLGVAWVVADNPAYYMFQAHYPLYVLPFLYVGAARGFGRVSERVSSQWISNAVTGAIALCIVGTLVGGVIITGLGHQVVPDRDEHERTLEAAIDEVPEDATLVTQNTVYPHVATRSGATFLMDADYFHRYERRYGEIRPEYVLIDSNLGTRPVDWSVPVMRAYSDEVGEEYGLYRYEDGIFIFKRGYRGPVTGITSEEYTVESRRYRPSTFTLEDGKGVTDRILTTNRDGVVWQGPHDIQEATLPPGDYTATIRVKVERTHPDVDTGRPVRDEHSRTSGLVPRSGSPPDRSLYIGVAVDDSAVVTARSVEPTDGWTNVTVDFTVDRTGVVEFQGYQTRNGVIKLKWIEVEEADTEAETR